MSTYNGRRAPNVSQYIANLNTIPAVNDTPTQQDFGNFDDDLTLFTNTQFFDFDMNEAVPNLPGDMGFGGERSSLGQANMSQDGNKTIDFVNQPNFQFADFTFPQSRNQRLSSQSLPPTPPNGLAAYTQQQQHHQPSLQTQGSASYAASPVTGEKRKATIASISSPVDLDDNSRYAAEEDKRRRNTAASARFRVKKKQREQALEKSAKEMSDKVHFLEARVGQLEMENKWLKGLITEKNIKGTDASSTQSAKADAAEKKKTVATGNNHTAKLNDDRSTEERKDGVGTVADADSEVVA